MINLDDKDKKLLQMLQQNSDINIKALSSELGLTKTPIYERIKRYEREGLIKKYVAILDPSKIESSIVIYCSVSLESQNLASIEKFNKEISKIPEVIECYLMGGSNDFLLKVIVRDLQDYHKFSSGKLAAISNVSQIKSTFVLNEVKRSTEIPLF